jgi:hypothetical protein
MRRLTAALFCLLGVGVAQDTIWLRQIDLGSDEQLIGIASQGERVVSVGSYTDPVNYDLEGLIVLFNQSGETLRTATIELGGDEQLIDVFLDQNGNCYVAGNGSISERNSWRPKDLIRSASFQAPYCIIAKFDSLGSQQWGIVDSPYVGCGIAVDSQGNCYATGAYGSGFLYDFCIAKILPDGDTAWTRRFDFNLLDILYRPAVDQNANLIAPGFSTNFSTLTGIIMKVSAAGETVWTRIDNSMPMVAFVSADVDQSGRIFVTGFCGDNENIDILILCLDSLGNEAWRTTYDFSSDDEGLGIVSDPSGYLYVTAYNADGDCVLLKLAFDGSLIWAERYDFGGYEYFQDLALDGDKNPIACGLTDFGANPYDLLLAKFSPITGIAQSAKSGAKKTGYCLIRNGELLIRTPVSGRYGIEIYNIAGAKLAVFANRLLNPGEHRFQLRPLPSGTYIIRIIGPNVSTIVNKGVVAR